MNAHELNPAAARQPQAAPSWRRLLGTRWIRALLVVEALVALSVALGLWALQRQTLDAELRNLASLSAAMAAQAEGTLDLAAATLRATRDELASGALTPGTANAQALLRARAAALPQFRALRLFDEQGLRVASSREEEEPAPAATVAARDFFRAARSARADPQGPLFVGSPYQSRPDGRPAIGLSMAWHDAAGRFRGVVALVAEPEFLDGGFERFAPSAETSLAIYRRDRELVSDGPGDGSAKLLPAGVMDRLWTDAAPARPRLVELPDGQQRLVAAHLLQRFPLMVVVTRDAQETLADWTDLAWLVGAFAGSALLVTLLLSLRNAREQALRHASEAALAAEQARAVRAFQAAQEGHWEWDPATRQTHLSARMRQLLGLPEAGGGDSDGGAPLDPETLHPDDMAPLREAFAAHREGRVPQFDATFRVRQADGGWRHVRARGHAWRDAAGEVRLFSGTAVDVTAEVEGREQRRRLEEQLQRALKLEALGTLAGGVAHDFNNILASVIGYGELARSAAPAGSAQARRIDQVLQAGQRGKALVERILSAGRGAPRAHAVFRLQPVVEEVLQLLAASLPAGIALEPRLRAPEAAIGGDPTLLYEAVMNLCTNGLQAMQGQADGGRLRVELAVEDVPSPRALFDATLAPGRYACLTVSDTGSGIAPEVMPRLFEPFFTTKGPQQGTGLGLAVVHGAMADAGGAIDVRSAPGRGSSFALYVPLAQEAPANARPQADAAADPLPMGRGQCVLVVDDEPALVELAEEMLASLGYEAFGAASGAQALERVRGEPDRFELVLTDEVMPGMAGTALAAELRRLRPDLPIVLASGYGGPQLERRAAAAGVTVLVRKPLARAELARAVAQALRNR
ncbi:MAG: ATP-binding protein [Rubrivivax sp.]